VRDGKPAWLLAGGGADQACYARLLAWGGWTGFAVLVLGFFVYISGLLPALIDVDALPRVWALSARELAEQEGHPSGWRWLTLLGHGDIVNLMGIALIASCSIVPLVAVTALYWRVRERLYALLAAAQVLVLVVAASGLVSVGH
jgi:hypothetical protein